MKLLTRIGAGGARIGAFGLVIAFMLGSAGNASASSLLFVPHSGKFPYHFAGSGGKTRFEKVNGTVLEAGKVDALALVLSPTLASTSAC